MTEREMLLRAVCESPDDDTPRLVFADWLDEHGEPERAEFIRAECWLRSGHTMRRDWKNYSRRRRQLFQSHGDAWRSELPMATEWSWGREFERGFINAVTVVNISVLVSGGQTLFASTPVRRVGVRGVTSLSEVGTLTCLHNLRELTIHCNELSLEEIAWFGTTRTAATVASFLFVHAAWQPAVMRGLDTALPRKVRHLLGA